MWIVGGYRLDYVEEKQYDGVFVGYEPVITVCDESGDEILCSRGRSEEDFINYLGYLTNDDVVEKAKEIIKGEMYKKDSVREFIEECAEHEYLWWG